MSTEVTARDLTRSFAHLGQAVVTPADNSLELLRRFYATECGLKAAVMMRRNLRSTAQLGDLRSHDLRRLAKELGMRASDYQGLRACRRPVVKGRPVVSVAVPEMHEAWRYGARVEPADEKLFVKGLDLIVEWCRKELRR